MEAKVSKNSGEIIVSSNPYSDSCRRIDGNSAVRSKNPNKEKQSPAFGAGLCGLSKRTTFS
jgi:hypothetical protein